MATQLTIQTWPQINGQPIRTIASSTKKIPQKFNRERWEANLPVADPATCVLCKETNITHTHNDKEEDWREMPSLFAPEPWHQLITPASCASWTPEKTRLMGGENKIAVALFLARNAMDRESKTGAQFSLQVGPHAAQNLGHPHYHLYQDHDVAPIDLGWIKDLLNTAGPSSLIFEDEGLEVRTGGHRTGQCLFLPTTDSPFFNEGFAGTLSRVIELYARKFKSTKGLSPDYSLELCVRGRKVVFGTFIPILNQIGTMEWLALFMPKHKGWNLLWSHEETARYLRE
ncbi:MAG: hypothetical protein HYY10_01265 [Candidatus Liptonbacteria bacterium]|nr:hypothetical protein [Candidatus Liptonbacteria bacterium]